MVNRGVPGYKDTVTRDQALDYILQTHGELETLCPESPKFIMLNLSEHEIHTRSEVKSKAGLSLH